MDRRLGQATHSWGVAAAYGALVLWVVGLTVWLFACELCPCECDEEWEGARWVVQP
jgi:hypothetical protein